MQVSREFLTTIIKASNCASKDETRLHLNGVHVRQITKDGFIIEATDGHQATQFRFTEKDFSLNYPIIIDRNDIKQLKTFLKEFKTKELFDIDVRTETMAIKTGNYQLHFRLVQRDFPRMDNILPEFDDEKDFIAINLDILQHIYKTFKDNKKHFTTVKIQYPKNKMSPIAMKFTAEKLDHKAVIMPVKV